MVGFGTMGKAYRLESLTTSQGAEGLPAPIPIAFCPRG